MVRVSMNMIVHGDTVVALDLHWMRVVAMVAHVQSGCGGISWVAHGGSTWFV